MLQLKTVVEVVDEADKMHIDELDDDDLQKYVISQTEAAELPLPLDEIVATLVIDIVYIDLHQTEHLLL